ncbi:unnamed protein product [Dracunculus medinensis]|uniref:Transposase n=1 Tax=Dracunculus medinensis TaxID=318479 RepID=A0A0N4U7J3_DRAME|nr:unnamed protein product [Dracunculus medinensis]
MLVRAKSNVGRYFEKGRKPVGWLTYLVTLHKLTQTPSASAAVAVSLRPFLGQRESRKRASSVSPFNRPQRFELICRLLR